jgi:hypothetical protein
MRVIAVTTSHPATDLHGADVIVESLSQAQPDLLRWMGLEPSAQPIPTWR